MSLLRQMFRAEGLWASGGAPGLFFLFLDLTDGGAEVVDVIRISGVEALEFLKTRVVFFVVDGLDVECWGWFGWSDISG